MPYVFQETQVGEPRPASEFPSLPSEVYEETFAQAFEENPIAAILRSKSLADDYRIGGKRLDFETAQQKLKDRGMEGDIKVSEAGITEAALDTLIERKAIERRRQEIFGQAEGGVGQGAARLGVAIGTSLVDPVNVATAFIPVIGEARYTGLLAKAGSTLGRTGVRAGVGAVEGVAGAALIEPIIAGSRRYEQADYDMVDSLLNVAFGGVFGAGLHSVGGAIGDGVRTYRGADPVWKGLDGVRADEIPLVQNLRQEIARGMDMRDVARVTETWSPAARRAVEPDIRIVTPAEAAHQALPPQVRENMLKQAIIQAVSDEPVNVQPIVRAAAVQRAALEEGFTSPQMVDPNTLIFRENDQNRMDAVREMFPGDEYSPIVAITDAGKLTILDGHNRAAVAIERGHDIPVVKLTRNEYDELQGKGFDDIEITYAALERAGQNDATSDLSRQFPGADLHRRGMEAWQELPDQPLVPRAESASITPSDDIAKLVDHAEKVLARETDTGTPTADALKMATEEASLAQSDLKAVADRLGLEAEDAELRDVLEAGANSERWAKAAELATICLTRGG